MLILKKFSIALLLVPVYVFSAEQIPSIDINHDSLNSLLNSIQSLEAKSDPKCYATASRLEDFIYGTPLSDNARFYKNNWQKQTAQLLWQQAEMYKGQDKLSFLDSLKTALQDYVKIDTLGNGDRVLSFQKNDKLKIKILKDDLRQYGSIAYSLRALLAAQQENMFSKQPLQVLTEQDINFLKQSLDLLTIALIQQADQQVRLYNRYSIELDDLKIAQNQLGLTTEINEPQKTAAQSEHPVQENNAALLRQIIKQKLSSYQEYNNISNQLFVRNLQVYFARLSWPDDEQEAQNLKNNFIDSIIEFAIRLYNESTKQALKNNHQLIKEADVNQAAQRILPHIINDYEDAIFYPGLDNDQKITIEAYDMDAFRDGGLHWQYLEFALDSMTTNKTSDENILIDVDPFAAELLSEMLAQYAVLVLRTAGNIGAHANEERLKASYIIDAAKQISSLVKLNNEQAITPTTSQRLASSDLKIEADHYFTDSTSESGINLMHRSSDWLNRLLRSYLRKDSNTGIITIPPAFGGSGVASEDINNDGFTDVLVLSGLGNHLYLNDGSGHFINITASAGLDWKRASDKQPGEPRQPLIADLDNDGWQDIIITYVNDDVRVYKNLGTGRFKDMSDAASLGGHNSVAGPATVFDFDNDGLLDIYVSYFGDYIHGVLPTLKRRNQNGLANKLFKNMGNFKFKDVTQTAGVGDTGWGQALTHTDLNSDGWQDIIVGNDFGINVYYINNKDGTFTDIANIIGTDKPSYTMNIGVADLNRDELPDIYISNIVTMNKDEKYVLPNEQTKMKFDAEKLANMRVVEANDLFLSSINKQGKLRYQHSDRVGRGYSSTGWAWDADFFDADMDGDDDLYVLNGMNEFNLYSSKNPYYTDAKDLNRKNVIMPVSTKESNVFFLNHGGILKNTSQQSGLDLLGNSRSATYLDYDNDGDLDIFLNNYHEKAVLYRNNANRLGNNWLKIRPLGDPEQGISRDAIGTRIVVSSKLGHQVWRELHGSTGYLSAHPKTQHFGLGKAGKVNVKVIWPNGKTQLIDDVPVNQSYVLDLKTNSFVIRK